MTRDNLRQREYTADETSGSSGLTYPVLIHKVQVFGGSNNTGRIELYDAASITGAEVINVLAAQAVYESEDFNPPMPMAQLTVDMTGSGAIGFVYFTRT